MALEISQGQAPEVEHFPLTAGASAERVTIDRHLYLTEDKSRVVEEADPDGRWLWATPGMEMLKADAVRLGAIVEKPDEADVKERVPAENKQRRGAATKTSK